MMMELKSSKENTIRDNSPVLLKRNKEMISERDLNKDSTRELLKERESSNTGNIRIKF